MSCQNEIVYIHLLELKSKLRYFRVSNAKKLVTWCDYTVGHFLQIYLIMKNSETNVIFHLGTHPATCNGA